MKPATTAVLLLAVVYFAAYLILPLGYDAQFYVSGNYSDYSQRIENLNSTAVVAPVEYYEAYPPAAPRITRDIYANFGDFGFKLLSVLICLLLPFLALRNISEQAGLAYAALSGVPMLFLAYSTLAQALAVTLLINFYSKYVSLKTIKWKAICLILYGLFLYRTHSFGLIMLLIVFLLIELKNLLLWLKDAPNLAFVGTIPYLKTLLVTAVQFGLIPIYCAFKGKDHRIVAAFLLVCLFASIYDIRTLWAGLAFACINAPKTLLNWKWFYPAFILNAGVQTAFFVFAS